MCGIVSVSAPTSSAARLDKSGVDGAASGPDPYVYVLVDKTEVTGEPACS